MEVIELFEFKDFDYLTDGEIDLRIQDKTPSNEEKGYVPAYKYMITLHNTNDSIGNIDIRIGCNENTYFGNAVSTYSKFNRKLHIATKMSGLFLA